MAYRTGCRERNRLLKLGDFWVGCEEWVPIYEQVREMLSTAGLPRPPYGLGPMGEYWLRTEVLADTMLVRYVLWYRDRRQTSGTKLTWFILDYLPEREPGQRAAMKKIQTHGKLLAINTIHGGSGASETKRLVRVLVDAEGLPVPVPPEVWQAMGLDGGGQ